MTVISPARSKVSPEAMGQILHSSWQNLQSERSSLWPDLGTVGFYQMKLMYAAGLPPDHCLAGGTTILLIQAMTHNP